MIPINLVAWSAELKFKIAPQHRRYSFLSVIVIGNASYFHGSVYISIHHNEASR